MMSHSNFEKIYDRYCPMLYGIAFQICNSKKKAEQLLIKTFLKIRQHDVIQQQYPAYCIILIRLLMESGRECHPAKLKKGIQLKQFENTPLINQIHLRSNQYRAILQGKIFHATGRLANTATGIEQHQIAQ